MTGTNIYKDDFISIILCPDGLYIESYKKGFTSEQLYNVLSSHPQIDITNFSVLKSVINAAPQPYQKFAKFKERIEIELIENDLKATVSFNVPLEELAPDNRENLILELSSKLKEKGVVFGIKSELLTGELLPGKSFVIAEGIPCINGNDCIIKMYELKGSNPEIHEDGKVNFYELKLINRIKPGDWIGERIDATEGTPGKSVKGEIIRPVNGKNYPLIYDKSTILETPSNGKTILYSKINGAVSYLDGKISISNHLDIDGDIDFKTGNIKFDGYVTIRGTVADGFSVEATRDIEINSEIGLGNVKGIISTQGSIFLKGGIASKGKVEINAAKDIFTKFIDNATVKCGGTLHIGFDCINSNVYAKEVVIDSSKGHIMGGNIKAEIRIAAPTIGSELEKRTVIEVSGFERSSFIHELESTFSKISELKNEQQKIKQQLSKFNDPSNTETYDYNLYIKTYDQMLEIKEKIKLLEEERKNISNYLKTKGEGEICVTKKVFPNCLLIVKKNLIEITSPTIACSFFVQDGQLKQI